MTAPAEANTPATKRAHDVVALALLLAVVFLFLLPALSMRAPVCYCDSPVESAPRVIAIARIVQAGGIPLWDFNTFAGARPFYVVNESAIFYPPMYPFYWFADLGGVHAATFALVLLPFTLHLLWAAAGAFVFGRAVVGLHPAGAFVLGLMYALSPEMGLQIITPDVAFLFSYLPWIMLAGARFLETGRVCWWVAGTVFLALAASVGTVNFIVRVYFIAALTFGLLWLLSLRGRDGVGARPLWRLASVATMFPLALGFNGFAWAGVIEGIGWIRGVVPLTYESASDLWSESSMPPAYLLTLWFPNFFGVLDNQHAWSIALSEGVTNLSALGGGVSIVLAAAGAAFFWSTRGGSGESEARLRRWTIVALVLFVLAIFTMMGRYTPVFRWLCAVLPFFAIPHAVYYRFAACWSLAILAGIGVSSLLTVQAYRRRLGGWGSVALCSGVGVVLAIGALYADTTFDGVTDPAYVHLDDFGQWTWFLVDPVLHFAAASAVLLAAFVVLPAHWRGWGLAATITVETIVYAAPLFYTSLLFEQTRPEANFEVLVQDRRYLSLAEHPHSRAAQELGRVWEERRLRYVGYNSRVDNQAWTVNARALFGYSSKPLSPRFREVVGRFTEGMPYDLVIRNTVGGWENVRSPADLAGGTFLRNMSVGYLVGNLGASPEWMSQTHDLAVHTLPLPLPYAYLQDRVVRLGDSQQLERLYATDLRRAAYVAADSVALPTAPDPGTGPLSAAEESRFAALQLANRVLSIDQSLPNRDRIEVDLERPAMLVLAETWHPGWSATVDGEPAAVLRVNYLQQGVWLAAGRHTVELRFFPPGMRYGLLVSAMALLITAVAVTFGARNRGARVQ